MKNNTNPPFSLFREYVKQLMDYGKKFIIIGNMNACADKDIFPYIEKDELWLGVSPRGIDFILPNGGTSNVNAVWFTNVEHNKRNTPIDLYKRYSNEYPKYLNYDAIEVGKACDIPYDYDGVMGVPITFLDKYCPKQFEIVGCPHANVLPDGWKGMSQEFVDLYYKQGNKGAYREGNRLESFIDNNGKAKVPYARVLIRKRTA